MEALDLMGYFGNTALAILTFSLLIYASKFNSLPIVVKVLGIFLLVNFGTELFARWLFYQKESNLYLLHYYTLFEFIAWSIFFKYLFEEKKWFQKYYWGFVSIIASAIIANTIFLEPFDVFNSNAKTLVQIILITFALIYFFNAFGVVDFSKPYNQSVVLINFAVLLYYSGSIFIFMFSKLLVENEADVIKQRGFWVFNALLNVVFQLLILISIWKIAFRKTRSLS